MTDRKRGVLFEEAMEAALAYCRLRLLPFNELEYEEALEYGLRRSRLHNRITIFLDVDRKLVEAAFARAESKFGFKTIDGVVVDHSAPCKDIAKAYDAFCDELEKLADLPERERHPDALSEDDLNRIARDLNEMQTLDSLGDAQ